jgi:hypothetical protein
VDHTDQGVSPTNSPIWPSTFFRLNQPRSRGPAPTNHDEPSASKYFGIRIEDYAQRNRRVPKKGNHILEFGISTPVTMPMWKALVRTLSRRSMPTHSATRRALLEAFVKRCCDTSSSPNTGPSFDS